MAPFGNGLNKSPPCEIIIADSAYIMVTTPNTYKEIGTQPHERQDREKTRKHRYCKRNPKAAHHISNMYFDGLLTAHYPNVIDTMHLGRKQKEISTLSNKIGEPILLTMGDDSLPSNPYIEQLFVPQNKKTLYLLADEIPKDGTWLHPIAFDEENDPIIATELLKKAAAMSGARADKAPIFELEIMGGQNINEIKDHLIKLAEHGLSVHADFDGKILQSDQLLAQKNQPRPENI